MKRFHAALAGVGLLTALVVPALLVPAVAPLAQSGVGGLRAGVGTGDITPPVGTPMFAYTAREAVFSGVEPFLTQESFDTNFYAKTFLASVGVHTRLRSRALVLDDDGTRVALVAVDLGGFPYEVHQAVVQRLEAAGAGIDAAHLLLSATHTHGGAGPIWPLTHSSYGILGGDLFDPRVFGRVADGIAASVLDAVAALAPARAGTASVEVLDATNNRNIEPHRLNPDVPAIERSDGKPESIDGTMTVVRADTTDGRPLGLWSTFAIHGTAFGDDMLHLTGDNQAFAERIVEDEIRRRSGLRAEDVVVHALANGAEGDISPRTAPPFLGDVPLALPVSTEGREQAAYVVGNYAGAEIAGRRVAAGALAAWDAAGRSMTDSLVLDTRASLLPLDGTTLVNGEPVGLLVALGCGGVVCPDGTELPLDVPGQGAKLPVAVGPPGALVPPFAPLQVLRVGDLLLGSAPFEVTKQMGARIKAAMAASAAASGLPVEHLALVGLANGYASYMATPEEYDASYYEGSFTLYGRQQGPAVQAGLVALTSAISTGAPAPAGTTALPLIDLSLPDLPPLLPEPDVGRVVSEPATTPRFGQVVFRWVGGDPAADDPHVRIERQAPTGEWQLVATDDGFEDIVTHRRPLGVGPHEWTETWETTSSTPTGPHRVVVTGASATGPYSVTSAVFEVLPAASPTPTAVQIDGDIAWFRATYPEPGEDTLRLRDRFASGGGGHVVVTSADGTARTLDAVWSTERQRYEVAGAFPSAASPSGAAAPGTGVTVSVVAGSMVDGFGNGASAVAAPSEPAVPTAPAPTAPVALPATGADPWVPASAAAAGVLLALAAVGVRRRCTASG